MNLNPVSLGGQTYADLPAQFSISTWNVWFDKHRREERFSGLLEILRQHNPEIMVFQEVTPPFVRAVQQQAEWLKTSHWISAIDHANLGVVVVSRARPLALSWVALPTTMGRRLLVAEFAGGVTVGVVHLESLANEEIRKRQLEAAFAALKPAASALLLGDFNFGDEGPEVSCLDPGFIDAWTSCQPEKPGYSRDTIANPMGRFGRQDKQERLDRILMSGLKPQRVEILGREPIADGLYPSDHFGLLAHVTVANEKPAPLHL